MTKAEKKAIYQEYRRSLLTLEAWKISHNYKGESLSSYYRYRKGFKLYRDTLLTAKIDELGGILAVYDSILAFLFDDVYGEVDLWDLVPGLLFKFETDDRENYHQPVILTKDGICFK